MFLDKVLFVYYKRRDSGKYYVVMKLLNLVDVKVIRVGFLLFIRNGGYEEN